MAEINAASSEQRAGVRRSKKLSTRVDLTPMVDLGFLLITFFVFTTNISKPVVMSVHTPAPETPNVVTLAPESATLTLVLLDNNQVFYFHGKLEEAIAAGLYGITGYHLQNGIGEVIRQKKASMIKLGKKATEVILIIKPSSLASYQNCVDILDEVRINDLKIYALVDLDEADKKALQSLNVPL